MIKVNRELSKLLNDAKKTMYVINYHSPLDFAEYYEERENVYVLFVRILSVKGRIVSERCYDFRTAEEREQFKTSLALNWEQKTFIK